MSKRSAVIVIDLLNGFFKKNPTLPDPLNEQALLKTVRRVVDAGRDVGVNIVFIKDNFLPEEVPIDKHFKIYGPHCVIGTPDAEVVPELDPKPGDFQIRKKHYSAFNSTRLDAVLRELDVRRLYITGAWTEEPPEQRDSPYDPMSASSRGMPPSSPRASSPAMSMPSASCTTPSSAGASRS